VNKTSEKRDLLEGENPFFVEFEYGANKEGYWTYDRMLLQLEDCIDILKVLHPDYDYAFLFDHSCGHDRHRPNALNPFKMTKGFGGAQPEMRISKILRTAGFLGEYDHDKKLRVGNIQFMVFQNDDDGPFYLSAEERVAKKDDNSRQDENRRRKKSKPELLDELALREVRPDKPTDMSKEEVQGLAQQNDIGVDTTYIG
jgi:hypothetical protein